MIFRIIYEDPETGKIKDLLHNLCTDQFYFIERACRIERRERQAEIFRQWQSFLSQEIAKHSSQK